MLLCYHMEIDVPKALTSDECLTADERLRKIAEGRAFIGEAKISLWIFLALESAFLIIYRILWPDLDLPDPLGTMLGMMWLFVMCLGALAALIMVYSIRRVERRLRELARVADGQIGAD